MGRSRYRFHHSDFPYFLTCTIVNWLPLLAYSENRAVIVESLKHLTYKQNLHLHGYVLMENHIHLIIRSESPSLHIAKMKSFTARQLIDAFIKQARFDLLQQLQYSKASYKSDRAYQLWQEGSHPIMIQSREMMAQKLLYMHNNPVRRGYVDDSLAWRFSSARNYAGMPGEIDISMDW
ncbi:MAG: transposase [Bacteroidetes bacterium]|nr:transposase [Bacteroidota bacterium]